MFETDGSQQKHIKYKMITVFNTNFVKSMIGSSCGKKKAVLTDQLLVGMIGMQYVHSSLLEFEISISSQCNRQQFDDDDGDHKEVA